MSVEKYGVGLVVVDGIDAAFSGNPEPGAVAVQSAGIDDDQDVGGLAGFVRQIAVAGFGQLGDPVDLRAGARIPPAGGENRIEGVGVGEVVPVVCVGVSSVIRAAENRGSHLGLGD